jgi:hypothetical protein
MFRRGGLKGSGDNFGCPLKRPTSGAHPLSSAFLVHLTLRWCLQKMPTGHFCLSSAFLVQDAALASKKPSFDFDKIFAMTYRSDGLVEFTEIDAGIMRLNNVRVYSPAEAPYLRTMATTALEEQLSQDLEVFTGRLMVYEDVEQVLERYKGEATFSGRLMKIINFINIVESCHEPVG